MEIGAVAKRRALRAIPIEQRRTWTDETRMSPPCSQCPATQADICPHPSHWSGVRLDSAFTALCPTGAVPDETDATDATDQDETEATAATDRLTEALRAAMAEAAPRQSMDVKAVQKMIDAAKAEILATVTDRPPLTVQVNDAPKVDVGQTHFRFPELMRMLAARVNVWIVGPAGSGKTTAAEQAAKALGVPFHFNGAIDTEYKLSGFVDAQGRIVSTAFRRAYTDGGLYLFDEADASMPAALLAFNAALSNGMMDFPGIDHPTPRHANFYCCAGANTINGGTIEYVGRARMDAAFLDRFAPLDWPYDAALEKALSGDDKWTAHVQRLRDKAAQRGLRVVISPRASIRGARLLAAGFSWDDVNRFEFANRMTPADYQALVQ